MFADVSHVNVGYERTGSDTHNICALLFVIVKCIVLLWYDYIIIISFYERLKVVQVVNNSCPSYSLLRQYILKAPIQSLSLSSVSYICS